MKYRRDSLVQLTQPPVQCVPDFFFGGQAARPDVDCHPLLAPKLHMGLTCTSAYPWFLLSVLRDGRWEIPRPLWNSEV